jgi:hypothetical protein
MANPLKGEVGFEAGGVHYTLVLGTYALAALQRRSGIGTTQFFNRPPAEWGVDDILGVLHCGLMRHHRSITEEQVSDIIDELGQAKVGELVSEAMNIAFPEQREGRSPRPTKLRSA